MDRVCSTGGLYSPFIAKYLDYVKWIRISLLEGSKWQLSLFDIDTYRTVDFRLRFPQGRGVIMAYDCVGYGVMSFWIAFIFASTVPLLKKFSLDAVRHNRDLAHQYQPRKPCCWSPSIVNGPCRWDWITIPGLIFCVHRDLYDDVFLIKKVKEINS